MARVGVLLGTRKGVFIVESDAGRDNWDVRGPFCEWWPSNHVIHDSESGAIYACATSAWYGPAIWRSTDWGETWTHSSAGLSYGDDEPALAAPWSLAVSNGTVYAGVEPAGLFRSVDQGETWEEVAGLRAHPSSESWEPGGGGLILHTIVTHEDPAALSVAISTGGVFHSVDDGETWEPRNGGTRAEFLPIPEPEFGQCPHHLAVAADGTTMYQQNHCGIYRSDDLGLSWVEITAGLPSEFGFAAAPHPRDPDTFYVAPLNGDDKGRFMPEARAGVWRTRDRGSNWEHLTRGLPERAYFGVFRQAMALDTLEPAGVYFGSTTGQLFASRDEGETWSEIATYLPPILSVEVATLA